jgi:hypothetical protein
MSTWETRLYEAFEPGGYENCMRRSLQTVILYEANRCISSSLPGLRPFQRKLAFLDMANALLDSLTILQPHQKAEVLWRTGTSKQTMNADTAWKRRKLLNKEIENIRTAISPLLTGRSHDQALDAYIQLQFEAVTGNAGPAPQNWPHSHNNALMCYRMYYNGTELDPTFPPPNPPKEIYIATEKPSSMMSATSGPVTIQIVPTSAPPASGAGNGSIVDDKVDTKPAAVAKNTGSTADDRRRMLQEVRDHLDLLKEFEGLIPAEEYARRKRELFLAMPPAPPPHSSKKARKNEE